MMRSLVIVITLFLWFATQVSAHPGNTDSDDCHYCRTNCSKWGVAEDARHCHGQEVDASTPIELSGIKVPSPVQTKKTPKPAAVQKKTTTSSAATNAITPAATQCSAQFNAACPLSCTAGNDADCCNLKAGYVWYHDWGCYPAALASCAAEPDRKCSSQCTAGNDYDCCLRMEGYTWYENWGCYPKQ